MANPGPLDSPEAGGPYNKNVSDQFLVGEFTFPIIGMDPPEWFYTNPENDGVCLTAEEIYQTYTEAVKLIEQSGEKFEYPFSWGKDLQSEHERYLCEKKIKRPVIVTDYPKDIKAFYMRMNDDEKTVKIV